MAKGIWADLEAKREAALAAQVQDGRGRTSLVRATADDVIRGVKDGTLKPDEHGIISVVMRDSLGKRAAARFEETQRENAEKAGLTSDKWFVGQEVADGKIQVTLSYLVPIQKED